MAQRETPCALALSRNVRVDGRDRSPIDLRNLRASVFDRERPIQDAKRKVARELEARALDACASAIEGVIDREFLG